MENSMRTEQCRYMNRRIGSTTFRVKVIFNDNDGETMEEKILRMVKNEAGVTAPACAIMEAPQMSRQSERSA